MTVSSQTSSVSYLGDGVTTLLPVPYYFLEQTDLVVTRVNVDTSVNTLILGSDYSVSGAGVQSGGAVAMFAPPLAGVQIIINRVVPVTQETDYVANDPFPAESHERALDKLTMLAQQVSTSLDRALLRPIGKDYFDAKGYRISNVGNPTQNQDAVTKLYNEQYIASLLSTFTGPLNNAANVMYIYPDGVARTVQTLATKNNPLLGSAGIGHKADTVYSALSKIEKHEAEKIYLSDFANPADADSTSGVIAAIAYANTFPRVEFIIPVGEYKISAQVNFDIPDFSTLRMEGNIKCLTGGHVLIGSLTRNVFGINAHGLDVTRTGFATGAANTGLQLANMAFSEISIKRVTGFQTGVFVTGSQPNGGFSYNRIYLGLIHDNQYNLFLSASGSGYTNENIFYGGSFNHSSGYPGVVEIANIYVSDYVAHPLNNNRFLYPSLEDNRADAIGARIEGVSNCIIQPRLENPANLTGYGVLLPSNSQSCYVEGGYGMRDGNIIDLGLYNRVSTLDGLKINAQGATPILDLKNQASSANTIIAGRDSGGVVTFSVKGNGDVACKKTAVSTININITPTFADNAAALSGGLLAGDTYRTSTGVLMVVY